MAFASFNRPHSAPVSDINMVPMIDVMLVLLVIFMVTAPLLTHRVPLQLPQASSSTQQNKTASIALSINATGQRYWNHEPVTREQAAQRFAEAANSQDTELPEILLRADKNTAYEFIAHTLADASRAGLTRISFVSTPEGTKDSSSAQR